MKKSVKKKINKNHCKTQKNKSAYYAVCVLHKNPYNVTGIIKFKQYKNSNRVKISYDIKNLSNGKHGFHVHNYGDLTDECNGACSHFNPFHKTHGGPKSKIRHVGDLGNLVVKNGVCKGYFYDSLISLKPNHKCNIIGRSIIVHEDEDDLGKGGNEESLKTGNAGKRLACGIIGLTNH